MSLQNICGKLDINRTLQRSLGNQRDFFSSAENLCLIIKPIHIFTLRIGNVGGKCQFIEKSRLHSSSIELEVSRFEQVFE